MCFSWSGGGHPPANRGQRGNRSAVERSDGSLCRSDTLTTRTAAKWTNEPTSYNRQWVRCDADGSSNCADIAARVFSTYTPGAADVGKTLKVRVVAHNSFGDSAPATSVASGVVS